MNDIKLNTIFGNHLFKKLIINILKITKLLNNAS